MHKFLTSNKTSYRLLRTIAQGIIGVIIANLDIIIGSLDISPVMKPVIVALVMAVLSPIMSCIKSEGEIIEAYGGESADDTEEAHEENDPDDSEVK